ncbi:MAG: ATP-binding protein [Nitrospiraceae bacterium]
MKQPVTPSTDFLAGGGEMGALMRAFDWSMTPLGPTAEWPQSLRSAISILLPSKAQIVLFWGAKLITLYNDAYRPVFGAKHPRALGMPVRESWSELWGTGLKELFEGVLTTGEAYWASDHPFFMERFGYLEETFFDVSYDPVRDETGRVGGVFCIVSETTGRVVGERRLRTLRELSTRTADAKSPKEACRLAVEVLAESSHDIPFAFLYLNDSVTGPRLVEAVGADDAPPAIAWPFDDILRTGAPVMIHALDSRFGPLPGGPWPEPAQKAMVLPIARAGQEAPYGFVVAGISPRRQPDVDYQSFLSLVASQIGSAIANALAYDEERKRAEALAELDRAKTAFFSNVSHEFRTPLTLMLGPIEDLLARPLESPLSSAQDQLTVAHRNSLRLLKLVNALLDFSRIEAGRIQASYEPTDLSAFTAELASNFRSACDRAGLRLLVETAHLSEPVYVDRDMWEKIVLNLLSNAFKFTMQGKIHLALRQVDATAELCIRDTGIGIPAQEIDHVFERFHRVQNAQGRTHEGTGIGLALVQELVKLHGGTVTVTSRLGEGAFFRVTIPLGKEHLSKDRIADPGTFVSKTMGALPYVEEALRWLPSSEHSAEVSGLRTEVFDSVLRTQSSRPRILVADDNADMREYVRRLLATQYEVVVAADGVEALKAVQHQPPDLILTDVMMPRMDGFALLAELRSRAETKTLPVIMLSARAGEESRIEGLRSGADDYLIKPFSAHELMARVGTHLEMSRIRREAGERVTSILDSITDGFVTFDRDWRFVYVNAQAERMNGMSRAALLGKTIWEVFPAAIGTTLEHEYRRAVAEHVCVDFESYYEPWDRWFTIRAYPTADGGLSAYFQDVTDRRRIEQTLRKSEQNLSDFFDNATVGLHWVGPDGIILRANQAELDLLGYRQDEYVGHHITEFHEDRSAIDDMLSQLSQGKTLDGYSARLRHKSGHIKDVLISSNVLWDNGRFVHTRCFTLDVTERKKAEEALREADRRKDEFLATLAHELRNPLAPLRNAAAIITQASSSDVRVLRARDMIGRQVETLTRLVDDLLDVSRITTGKIVLRKTRLDVATVVERAVEICRSAIEAKRQDLQIVLPQSLIFMNGDLVRLTQVLANILNNASKFTPEGGHICVTVQQEIEDVVIRIRDNGSGIAPEILPHIFALFVQADRSLDRSLGGLGLGLTLVRQLMALHGGTVEAVSEGIGKGSEFVMRLPVIHVTQEQEQEQEQERKMCAADHHRILVVDDNLDGAESLALLLKLKGHEAVIAEDGPTALRTVPIFKPSIVLLDLGLPEMDGHEVARRLRAAYPQDRFTLIALTGYGQEEDRRRTKEAGFDHHLVKPVDPKTLDRLMASHRVASPLE